MQCEDVIYEEPQSCATNHLVYAKQAHESDDEGGRARNSKRERQDDGL